MFLLYKTLETIKNNFFEQVVVHITSCFVLIPMEFSSFVIAAWITDFYPEKNVSLLIISFRIVTFKVNKFFSQLRSKLKYKIKNTWIIQR